MLFAKMESIPTQINLISSSFEEQGPSDCNTVKINESFNNFESVHRTCQDVEAPDVTTDGSTTFDPNEPSSLEKSKSTKRSRKTTPNIKYCDPNKTPPLEEPVAENVPKIPNDPATNSTINSPKKACSSSSDGVGLVDSLLSDSAVLVGNNVSDNKTKRKNSTDVTKACKRAKVSASKGFSVPDKIKVAKDCPNSQLKEIVDNQIAKIAAKQLSDLKAERGGKVPPLCLICNKSYSRIDSLNLHLRTVHLKEKRFKCLICDKGFTSNGDLKRHTAFIHTSEKNFSCKKCPMKFVTKKEVKKHCNFVHSVKKDNLIDTEGLDGVLSKEDSSKTERSICQLVCKKCAASFPDAESLRQHGVEFHSQVLKDHGCLICERKFADSQSLKRHVKMVHEKVKEFECSVCSKKFASNYDKNRHEKSAHSEPTGLKHECDVCKRKFAFPQKLKRHVRDVHLKEKSYKCSICQKSFSRNYDLKVHEKSCSVKLNALASKTLERNSEVS